MTVKVQRNIKTDIEQVYKKEDYKPLRSLKRNEMFKKHPSHHIVWLKGPYDRSSGTFCCYKFYDINGTSFIRADRLVYTDFIF